MNRQPTDPPFLKSVTLRRDLVPSFDVYPYSIPAIKQLASLDFHPRVTFFVSENGAGKSTLLEAIAVTEGFNPEGGSRHAMFKTADTHDDALPRKLWLGKNKIPRGDSFFLRAESFYNLSSYVDQLGFAPDKNPYGPVPLHQQSHGEAFLTLMVHRFSGNGIISSTSRRQPSAPSGSSRFWRPCTTSSAAAASSSSLPIRPSSSPIPTLRSCISRPAGLRRSPMKIPSTTRSPASSSHGVS